MTPLPGDHRSKSRKAGNLASATVPAHVDLFIPEAGSKPFPGYELVRLRGRGGFATVWEVVSPTGKLIALKFMSSASASTTAREVRSLQTIQTLDHTNLLRIRQVWSIPGWVVIAMDLADASLLDLLELYLEEYGQPPDVQKLFENLIPAADALDFLNGRTHRIDGRLVGLQHGDIKPNNILLTGEVPRLADYGLATPTGGGPTPCPRHGTAEYCAPEVFHGLLSDKSDQFSFAVTYHVLRTGRFPFPTPPANRESLRNYVRPEPDLSALPVAEQPFVARALSVAPQSRFPSCSEFMLRLLTANRLTFDRNEDGTVTIRPATDSMLLGRSQMFR